MLEVTPLSPEFVRGVAALARSLVSAARSRSIHPPEHSANPFTMRLDSAGAVEPAPLRNTWEGDGRGNLAPAVIEAVDPDTVDSEPLAFM